MDLKQEEKDELNNYANGAKFILLYEQELALVKELQDQISTYDANLQRVQTIADNWKKEEDGNVDQEMQPLEARLDKVKEEIKKWTENELQRQLDQITQFERSKNAKLDRITQIQKEVAEKQQEIENAKAEILKLKNPEEAKRQEKEKMLLLKQMEEENKKKELLLLEEKRGKEEEAADSKKKTENRASKQLTAGKYNLDILDSIAYDLDNLNIEQDLLGLNLENPVTEAELMNKIIQDFDDKVKFLDQIAEVLRD